MNQQLPVTRFKRFTTWLIVAMLLAAIPGAAIADITITPQIDSPVTITHMETAFVPVTSNYLMCPSFTNTSSKIATAVEFRFEVYSVFNALIWSGTGDSIGVFSAGVAIDGPQSLGEIRKGLAGATVGGANVKLTKCFKHHIDGNPTLFKVSVGKVHFSDDSAWAAPTTEPTAPISTSDATTATH